MSQGYEILKKFYEESEIGHQVAKSLKEGTCAMIEFEGDPKIYKMHKKEGRTIIEEGKPEKAEMYFKFSNHALFYLFNPPTDNVSDYVNRLCDCVMEKDSLKRVEVKLLTSVIDAWRKGYISMMKLGGARAIATVATLGIRIPKKLLDSTPK